MVPNVNVRPKVSILVNRYTCNAFFIFGSTNVPVERIYGRCGYGDFGKWKFRKKVIQTIVAYILPFPLKHPT